MGLDIEHVHVMQRQKGTNHLTIVSTNPYTRLISEGEYPVIIQKGAFWTDGGDRILLSDLPQWVRPAISKMSLEAQIRVGLKEGWDQMDAPEEDDIQTLNTPTDESPSEPEKTVVDIVYELDPANDEHWTKDGKPDLQAVSYMLDGKYTTRADIEEATDGYRRPGSEPVVSEPEETTDGDG